MEKQQLPNSILILILGILSLPLCCCYGGGIVTGIVALVLSKKAKRTYLEDPESYSGYSNVKIGRVLAIIGIILGVISIAVSLYINLVIGEEEFRRMMEEWSENMKNR